MGKVQKEMVKKKFPKKTTTKTINKIRMLISLQERKMDKTSRRNGKGMNAANARKKKKKEERTNAARDAIENVTIEKSDPALKTVFVSNAEMNLNAALMMLKSLVKMNAAPRTV